MGCDIEEEKIEGFDKWEVENAAREMTSVQQLDDKPKFKAVVIKELERQAEAAKKAVEKATVEDKVSVRMKKIGLK